MHKEHLQALLSAAAAKVVQFVTAEQSKQAVPSDFLMWVAKHSSQVAAVPPLLYMTVAVSALQEVTMATQAPATITLLTELLHLVHAVAAALVHTEQSVELHAVHALAATK